MNTRMIARSLGLILLCLAALLLLPLIAGLYYGESVLGFIVTIAISAAAAFVLTRFKPESTDISAREGFVIVGMGWILLSVIGALPFVISGDIPNYIDALFETASGLTTTGATIMTDIEAMSRGGMFWRMFTHWIGGMGVLVFIMAVMPMNGAHSMHLMRAEVPGPTVGKLVPRVRQTARILYLIYFALTIIEAVLLRFGGMSNYDALLHAFANAGTGGFSTRAASIAAFDSVYIEMVIAVFMLIFSVNFNLYYLILLGRIRDVLHDEELRCYLVIVAFATVTMGINIAIFAEPYRYPHADRRDGRQHGRRHKAIARADIYKDHGLRLYEDRKPPHGEACGHKRAAHRPRYCPRCLRFLCALCAHARDGDASRLLRRLRHDDELYGGHLVPVEHRPRPWPCGPRRELRNILAGVKAHFYVYHACGQT